MNKIMIGIGAVILLLGGLVWFARPDSESNNKTAVSTSETNMLVVGEANKYDFGSISMAAGRVVHQFRIKNTGNESITLYKVYTSCMCTTAELTVGGKRFGPYGMPGHGAIPRMDQTISPNEEVTVEVVFDPAAHGPAGVGRITRSITIEQSAGLPIELAFSAVVTP